MFGINGGELIVLILVALVILGPERLPQYAEQLAHLVRSARRFAKGAQAQMREELGPEFDDIDWQKLDPRQYDPRRIVRDALSDVFDDEPAPAKSADATAAGTVAKNTGTVAKNTGTVAKNTGTVAKNTGTVAKNTGSGVDLGKKTSATPGPAAATVPFDEDAT